MKILPAVAVATLFAGCGPLLSIDRQSSNAPKIDTRVTYPHEVDYVLLAQTTGEACMGDADLEYYKGRTSRDADAIEPIVLFERAKYDAITKVAGADGLVGIVARTTSQKSSTCVSVSGRAYRISGLRAVGPSGATSRTAGNSTGTPTTSE